MTDQPTAAVLHAMAWVLIHEGRHDPTFIMQNVQFKAVADGARAKGLVF